MNTIYHYDGVTGLPISEGAADANPLDASSPLLPAYATPTKPIVPGHFECARYLTPAGDVPAHHSDGEWLVQPDWCDVKLWSTKDGQDIAITEPNVTPDEIGATVVPYPGPGYVWRDEHWQADPELQHQLAEQAAAWELASRHAVAAAEINRIKSAVDGGYAKPSYVDLLPKLQRYLYELPYVRTKPGWPEQPLWPDKPTTVI